MPNDLTITTTNNNDDDDDGFSGSINFKRRTSNYVRWTDTRGWEDRDGLKPPEVMLVGAIGEAVQTWKDKIPELISIKCCPDADEWNDLVPIELWPDGINGKDKPFKHVVIVALADPGSGRLYKFISPTTGAHIAFGELEEAVITMRAFRGARVLPLVRLAERKWKTSFGERKRPHFEIVEWKTPGGEAAIPSKPAPQLTAGPAAPSTASTTPPAATAKTPRPHPMQAPTTKPTSPKTPVKLSEYTLGVMGTPKPVTTAEQLNDSLDDLPWDSDETDAA
jgi:hypothetical protein